ncbi:hypothetical protein G2W53_003935 [Senna tora]|uniref:Putative plant transposon protein domain-containing protein n=1 Tax=Senna tora TaxID=362788 RepID=A0A835CJQ1_9FABA|nr:hypothetical protein G2W53_003935 [Senna tora]
MSRLKRPRTTVEKRKNKMGSSSSSEVLNITFFEEQQQNNPQFDFIQLLNSFGLYKLLKLNKKYNPNVIRLFYSNLKWYKDSKCVMSEVRGKPIVVSEAEVAKLLGVDTMGYKFDDLIHSLNKLGHYNSHTVCNFLLPEPQEHILDTTNFAASNFGFSNRVLHYIVQGCITNKQGNHSYASASEQFVMYCINTQDPFNLPHFILEKMQRIARNTGLALSYASLISLILEKQGVDPLLRDGNDEKPDVIDETTLYNMRFEPYQGHWYAKQMTKAQKKARTQKEKAAGAQKAREEETELDG